jgi:DNA-binding response OmpR family regulator
MKFLIIEDDKGISHSLKKSLKIHGYNAQIAENGKKALELLKINDYSLIILDMILPFYQGKAILKKIRENNNSTPVLILSCIIDTETKVEILNLGADDYLNKPFSFKELLARIKAILRRSTKIKKQKIKSGDLVINPQKFNVSYKGDLIKLTKKEFDLLNYLIKNQDKVISRNELLENIWDVNADPFSNTIEAHIRSLRKKLGECKKLVKTIPGRGYIFESGK